MGGFGEKIERCLKIERGCRAFSSCRLLFSCFSFRFFPIHSKMSSVSVSSKPTTKAWYFKAGEKSVKLIDYNPDNVRTLLECRTIDCITIYTTKGIFTILFNDNGLYEDTVFNKPAHQVLGKLPINWGTMNGNYIVRCSKEAENEDEDGINVDMPSIDFKEWITLCSDVLMESHKRKAERMKAEGFKKTSSYGGFSIYTA